MWAASARGFFTPCFSLRARVVSAVTEFNQLYYNGLRNVVWWSVVLVLPAVLGRSLLSRFPRHPSDEKFDCSSFARCCELLRPPCAAITVSWTRSASAVDTVAPPCAVWCFLHTAAPLLRLNGLDCALGSLRAAHAFEGIPRA